MVSPAELRALSFGTLADQVTDKIGVPSRAASINSVLPSISVVSTDAPLPTRSAMAPVSPILPH